MARVFEQLNFYDIFGYLMPGAVVVGCALLLVDATFPDATSDLSAASGAELTGLLFLAYLVGHIVQAVARRIEPPLNAIMWGGWPSEALLRPDDKRFTTEFDVHYVNLDNIDKISSTPTFMKRMDLRIWRSFPMPSLDERLDTLRVSFALGYFHFD